jgi:murein DD-endopeptidase MepM/ murein hydrolase activator NlpD
MQNDTLKSVLIFVGSLVLLFLVATSPKIQREGTRTTASTPRDSAVAKAASNAPDYAGIVGRNTSFFDLMRQCGLDPPSIDWIQKAVRNVYDFRRIYPGQHYEVYAADDGSIEKMKFSVSDESYIHIDIKDGEISAEKKDYEFTSSLNTASGVITSSLYEALDKSGTPVELGNALANNIFAWDVDFHHDIQKGDYFRIIYEEKVRYDGLKKTGNIIAAELYAGGKSHYAFLYPDEHGRPDYFDETGKSLRKQLIKAPLPLFRISSGFSFHRFHPVLHHWAPHLGVDYAAPYGTPVMAAGDGTVLEAGRTYANGNFVKIRHANDYVTYYLHLSRFAKGVSRGARVSQSQVIGYVGATGLATGPHLDYRVAKNGVFVNPRTISLPPANPISRTEMAAFIDLRDRHLAKLSSISVAEGAEAPVASSAVPGPMPRGAGSLPGMQTPYVAPR